MLRLREHHIRKMQTVVARALGMPRVKRESQAVEYCEKKARERLIKVSQSAKHWFGKLGKVREEAQRRTKRLLEQKKQWRAWITSILKGLRCLEQGLKAYDAKLQSQEIALGTSPEK